LSLSFRELLRCFLNLGQLAVRVVRVPHAS
jgi:hypothetical protein